VSVPLATSPLGVLVPLAPPAGIAAPAHPTVPSPSFSSSASAAFSPPSEGNRGAPPPHRFHIGPALRRAEVGKKGGGYSHSTGSMSMSAGLHSAGRSPTRSVAPGAPGHIAGSLRQPSTHRFMHATQHRPNASSSMRAPRHR
jgi:hypothetical protein